VTQETRLAPFFNKINETIAIIYYVVKSIETTKYVYLIKSEHHEDSYCGIYVCYTNITLYIKVKVTL
jgi:hypothetical protein